MSANTFALCAYLAATFTATIGFAQHQNDYGDYRIESSALSSQKAATGFLAYNAQPWKKGIVPVKFHSHISKAHQNEFWQACQTWSDQANVKCRPKTLADKNYLLVTDVTIDRCWTDLGSGSSGGERVFNFAMDWCWDQAALVHEIGHVLGLMHEHQRPDRDLYLDVHPENAGEFAFAFEKLTLGPLDNNGPYDFLSIMHYWDAAYSTNGKPILVPKKGYEKYAQTMGRTNKLSIGDINLIKKIYGAAVN